MAAPVSFSAMESPTDRARPALRRLRLNGWGSAALAFTIFLTGSILSVKLHSRAFDARAIAGIGYLIGTPLSIIVVRRRSLPSATAVPPVIFLAALICAQATTADHMTLVAATRSVAKGTAHTLGESLPWLLGGTAAGLIAALVCGLPASVRELRATINTKPTDTPPAVSPKPPHPVP